MFTAGQKIEYPYIVTHRGHIVCRIKREAIEIETGFLSGSKRVLYPDGTHPGLTGSPITCRTCNVPMTALGIVAGHWEVRHRMM